MESGAFGLPIAIDWSRLVFQNRTQALNRIHNELETRAFNIAALGSRPIGTIESTDADERNPGRRTASQRADCHGFVTGFIRGLGQGHGFVTGFIRGLSQGHGFVT
jgi:hypothetical protein